MDVFMDIKHIRSIDDLKIFVLGSKRLTLKVKTIEDKYEIIERFIDKFNYPRLSKKEKHIVLIALKILTSYKHSQLHQLIETALLGRLSRKPYIRLNIHRTYTGYDIGLLEKTDELHYRLSAAATYEIMRREYEMFGKRESEKYKAEYLHHTQARKIPIGETTKPQPNNIPGSIRVDTVS